MTVSSPLKRPVFRLLRAVLLVLACTTAAFAQTPPDAASGLALATSRNCMGCHQVDRKRVGPAFRSVAERYAGRPDMQAKLEVKIRKGGGGAWGAVPMPSNPKVSEAESRALAAWILRLR